MPAAFAFPVNRPVDTNGLTMSGAKAFFYTTETLAPADVYTTSDLSVAHANPVVADSGGLFPNIFLDPAIAYRMVLKSAVNITMADVDPVVSNGGVFDPGYTGGVTQTITAKLSERISVKDFGATGDGVTNDSAAFVAAIAFLKATAKNDATIYKGSSKLFVPAGHYYMGTTTLDLTHTIIIEGEGVGQGGGVATKLRWAAGATGIRIQRYNTSGAATVDGVTHYGGDGSILRGLHLVGGFTNMASEGAFHGVHAKARFVAEDCIAEQWQGNGFNVVAYSGIGAPLEGNANNFALNRCSAWFNTNGIYIDGADANAGSTTNCDTSYNRQWGIWDSSFLGNTHTGAHAADNGINYTAADNIPTIVSQGGNRYYVRPGQAVGAKTNAPTGTTADNTWWGYAYAGGVSGFVIPAWASGQVVREGGAYHTDDASGSVVFTGCYSEGGQGPSTFEQNAIAIGGLHGSGFRATDGGQFGGYLRGSGAALVVNRKLVINDVVTALGTQHDFGPATGTGDCTFNLNNTNNFSQLTFKRSGVADGTFFSLASGMYYDSASHHFRVAGVDKAVVDTNGLSSAGLVVSTSPSAGVGYATGAGAAVTQATSKSTATPAINKVCGQVTMNNAALAAGAKVSFVVTNNIVAATDTVIVSVASGGTANAYRAAVTAVAAASGFTVTVENITVGSLSEAPVINFSVIKAVAA